MTARLQIISDVHLELRRHMPTHLVPPVLAPTIALLGDIGAPHQDSYGGFIKLMSERYENVIVLAGNHEYYHSRKDHRQIMETDILDKTSVERDNVYLLNDYTPSVEIDGVIYVGSTLWSHVPKEHEYAVTHGINDYKRVIRRIYDVKRGDLVSSPVSVTYTNGLHQACVASIKRQIENESSSGKPVVVLTHHAPSMRSIHKDFEGSPLNSAYATDLEHMMRNPVVMWCHGHTHRATDYVVGPDNVRVVANPMGYPGEKDTGYNPELVLEIAK